MTKDKGYYQKSFNTALDYFYKNNIPVQLVYNDDSTQTVNIISYDNYNIICENKEEKKSFVVFKHALKRIETEINLKGVIEKN